ncbi:SLOG family protein [Streptomyces sp. NPDC003077]|uniref:SLOG family protein n=1 Tax=Streptomyces sp. NPDC003077 TaxID=3154443 RepID=UPI0033A013D2
MELADPRVLVCGDRWWAWPGTVVAVLDRLEARHGDRLVVIDGAASGADWAAHVWCERNGLGDDRHRCHPVDWQAARRANPRTWRSAGPERNTRMLLREHPQLIIAFHARLGPRSGGTSDMCLRGLLIDVPTWLVTGPDPDVGRWLLLAEFPEWRRGRVRDELDVARQARLAVQGDDDASGTE